MSDSVAHERSASRKRGDWQKRWASIRGVAARDLLEFVRDRRTLFVTLLMPMAMYPILALASTLGLKTAIADLDARQAPLPIVIAVSGSDAEAFADRIRAVVRAENIQRPSWPASVSIEVIATADARGLLDDGQADAWIYVPRGSEAMLVGQRTLDLNLRLPDARRNDTRLRQHLLALMRAIGDEARGARVRAAGLPTSLLEPLKVKFADEQTGQQPTSLDGVMPMAVAAVLVLLALLTATGGFYPAIDAIAGEKERGTIETLLIVPASTFDILTGKFLAVFAVTLASLAANALSVSLTLAVLLRILPDGLALGVSFQEAAACAGVTLVVFVGLASVAAAACLAVTSAARSTKEAQNSLTPVILLASGLAGSALVPGVGGPLVALVPFAGQVSVARETLVHESTSSIFLLVLISLVSSALFTWLLLRAAAAALADEEILFRGPDSAGSLTTRPAPRDLPTPMQGFSVGIMAFAMFWYAQGLSPTDLMYAIPIQQVALLVPLAVVTAWQRVNQWRTFRLVWPSGVGRGSLTLVAAAITGAGFFIIGAAILLAFRDVSEISPAGRELSEKLMSLLLTKPWWVSSLLIAVLPAFCEELFFRGWMLSAFTGKRPSRNRMVTAVLLQAAAFAAFHLAPERMPQTFMLGVVLAWMTLTTGSLIPAIVAHAAHNAMPLVFLALAGSPWAPDLGSGSLPSYIVLGAAAAVVTGLALVRRAAAIRRALILAGLCLCGSLVQADDPPEVTLAPRCGLPFQNGAVLQQKMPVPVWGTSLPGAKVTVTFIDQTKTTDADEHGRWRVVLDPMTAKPLASVHDVPEGKTMRIVCAKSGETASLELENLVVGEVWLCAGQSNMAGTLRRNTLPAFHGGPDAVINYPALRQLVSPQTVGWVVCTPENAPQMKRVCFFFARRMQRDILVPVGIINAAVGGSSIEPWLNQKPFEQGSHYTSMIAPLAGYPIRGVIWYQGESNERDGRAYEPKLRSLITGWRDAWHQGDFRVEGGPHAKFSVYVVQLPGLGNSPLDHPAGGDGRAEIREAQRRALELENTDMAITIDIGALIEHPPNKFDTGERLARLALCHDYGFTKLVPSGPVYKSHRVDSSTIRVSFSNADMGLMLATKDGTQPPTPTPDAALSWIAIQAEDGSWHFADARIDGSDLIVSSKDVAKPVAVRYAWTARPVGSLLYNKEGLPAAPFSTIGY